MFISSRVVVVAGGQREGEKEEPRRKMKKMKSKVKCQRRSLSPTTPQRLAQGGCSPHDSAPSRGTLEKISASLSLITSSPAQPFAGAAARGVCVCATDLCFSFFLRTRASSRLGFVFEKKKRRGRSKEGVCAVYSMAVWR